MLDLPGTSLLQSNPLLHSLLCAREALLWVKPVSLHVNKQVAYCKKKVVKRITEKAPANYTNVSRFNVWCAGNLRNAISNKAISLSSFFDKNAGLSFKVVT